MSGGVMEKREGSLVAFFVITYAITWGIAALFFLIPNQIEAMFGKLSVTHPLFILAVAGPTISATILTARSGGWAGLGRLYRQIIQWRFGVQWYAVVLIGLPIIGYVDSLIWGAKPQHDLSTLPLVLLFLLTELVLGPLGEELGWRGFALPRLLDRFNPLAASLVLGVFWGLWHLPSFFLAGLPQSSLAIPLFLVGALALSILATWLYLHAGRSVLVTVLFHLMVNVSIDGFGASFPPFAAAMVVLAMLVVALDRRLGWLKREPGSTGDTQSQPAV